MGKLREVLNDLDGGNCALPLALEAMGERWSFMILRAAFNGVHHFEEFQQELNIARNILSNRLSKLVDHGIMAREVMAEDRRKVRYQLTEKGIDLLPAMIALRQWGEKWGAGVPSTPVLVDARDEQPIGPVRLTAHDGRVIGYKELLWKHRSELQPLGQARVRADGPTASVAAE
ncbi:winged helix-turn-helix transcriptional regulator [Sphingopyxis sp. FD7]|jgi:DNA-binding HxlR family transcriptional regulator|uniref:winged helix-turn-helix transcriptional regulator n=1 Tax=Sphingopyxis sp. FD7 TaxID=1914525 RepID=UPI000DC62BD9|nr:helix-turn-helix domain-containing protein [Sphingopyxis sp. FD7]BBB13946.1 HxlR family transcriptional regulator [Sphingopyxis sp. FD7]